MSQENKLPLVYSCSGASSAAQMTDYIAIRLDRLKVAEMSCIAGVGGDVKPLVRSARSGGPSLHSTAARFVAQRRSSSDTGLQPTSITTSARWV